MDKSKNRKSILASIGLLTATVLWGLSFIVVKDSTSSIPVLYLLALRYTIAVIMMALLFLKRLRKITKPLILQGAILGGVLFVSQFFQTLGCKYTTAGKNAFITTIYVIIVPFLHWFINKKRPHINCIFAAVIAIIGIGLLSLKGDMSVNVGDALTFICGVGLSIHIIYIDKFAERQDTILLTIVQFFFANIFSWVSVAATGTAFPLQVFEPHILMKMLYLGIFSTLLGFLLQITCQKYTTPNVAAILLTMESVFGMAFSIIFLGEVFTKRLFIGCVLMLGAVLMAEFKPGKYQKQVKNSY